MRTAKEYGAANVQVFTESDIAAAESEAGKKTLWIVVSSDRGLCGGIHSSVSKKARNTLTEGGSVTPSQDNTVVILGDKPKQQLGRSIPNSIALSFNQIGRQVPSFADACAIADQIDSQEIKYDSVKIIYNKVIFNLLLIVQETC